MDDQILRDLTVTYIYLHKMILSSYVYRIMIYPVSSVDRLQHLKPEVKSSNPIPGGEFC